MAGSLRQRGEGSWQLRVHLGRDPETGRKRYAERTFHGTKRQAERALAALVAESESMSPAIGSVNADRNQERAPVENGSISVRS